jgi:hypothetical protein
MKNFELINKDLVAINKLIEDKNLEGPDGALALFKVHVKDIIEIGRFSTDKWNTDWRRNVYKFGTKFKNLNPIDFLNILKDEKQGLNKDQQEVLDFYYSEIEVNSLPDTTCTDVMDTIVKIYPYNPEFRHTFGIFYIRKNDFINAIEQFRFALSRDKENYDFLKDLFNCYYKYFESLIEKSDYNFGLKLCDDLLSEKIFESRDVFNNYLISIRERFKDYVILNSKIKDAESEIKNIVSKETNNSQLKVIEILGFFTAIIAFVFSTITVGKNYAFREAIIFNVSLGQTLLIFALAISLLFSKRDVKKGDFRIWLIVILILSLFILIYGTKCWV